MFWHGSPRIFSSFSLADSGRLTGASNGALGVWCGFDGDRHLAARFAGKDGALYGIEEVDGPVYPMTVKELAKLHDEAGDLPDIDAEVAFYDELRRDLIGRGFARIDIIEKDGEASMCIILDPERAVIVERVLMAPEEVAEPTP
ncbi:hypothetical protein LAZ40_05705 [Cereibacter sphaeroides]|uniref:hypothetical protein n=1 Tax=Cereibacter sphaeroides TaxID=1063 RepID=UPI001F2F282B|nr:hypothetical protein [Cereibacter sphaeroides]MCE6958545.1 hypothetical protein [Cereibacter sphaeroides]MCE6972792.1 hypothetical protein [Cereibacter sphaeroides]